MSVDGRALAVLPLLAFAVLVPVSTAGASIALVPALLVWVAARATGRARPGPSIPWLAPALLLWVAGQVASALVAATPEGLGGVAERSIPALLVFAAGDLLAPFSPAGRRVTHAFLASLAAAGAYATAQHLLGVDYIRRRPLEPDGATFVATAFHAHHLTAGGVLGIGLLLAAGIFLTARSAGLFLWSTLAGGALGLGLLATGARSAWAGGTAGLLAAAAREGRRSLATALVLIALAGGVVFGTSPSLRSRAMDAFAGGESGNPPRVLLVRTSLRMLAAHPILGVGPGNFERRFPEYRVPGVYESIAHPHNDLLRALLDGGIPSGLGYLGILAAPAVFLLRSARRIRDPLRRGVLLGALGGTAFLVVGGIFQTYLADVEVAWAYFLVLGLAVSAARDEESPTR